METCSDKLILAFLELKHRKLLNGVIWTGDTSDESSIAILHRRFMALAASAGIALQGETPEDKITWFEEGKFIKKRPLEKYAVLVSALEEYQPQLREYVSWRNDSFQFRHRQLTGLFIGLLSFKLKTDFRYYGPPESMSAGSEYAHFLRMHAFDTVAVRKIDTVLGRIIDPAQAEFDMERLATEFDYPKEDYESRYLHERINETF